MNHRYNRHLVRRIAVMGALAAMLGLLAPTAGASADTGDGTSTESSAAPSREDRSAARAARAAARAELRAWLASHKELRQERATAFREARGIMRTALAGAANQDQIRAAKDTFKESLRAAKAAFDAGLAELGPRPVVPRG